MNADIYIVRHGNTFDPGDTLLRVGARTDLALSVSGCEQADRLGRHFLEKDIVFIRQWLGVWFCPGLLLRPLGLCNRQVMHFASLSFSCAGAGTAPPPLSLQRVQFEIFMFENGGQVPRNPC